MRKVYTFLFAALAVITLGVGQAAAQGTPKLGFINSQRIIAEAPGAQTARQTLEREMEGYRKEMGQLEEQIQKLVTDYEQKRSMLSADARTKQEEAIMQKQREAQQRAMQLEDQAAKRQSELVEPVMRKIQEVIDSIRDEGKYAMIFDVAAGGVIAADPALDLTDQVLSRLRPTATNKR
jgi:outer membrane protein